MALVTTPGAADATSYSDVTAASARAVIDIRGTTFAGLASDTLRERLLAMATLDIDAALLSTGRQRGTKYRDDQALEQPRDNGILATSLVLATQLQAFHLAERHALGEIGTPIANTSNVRRDKVGELETEFFAPTSTLTNAFDLLPAQVRALLTPLLASDASAWGTGTVVRGA